MLPLREKKIMTVLHLNFCFHGLLIILTWIVDRPYLSAGTTYFLSYSIPSPVTLSSASFDKIRNVKDSDI